jgi:hypothetical protein
VSRASRRFRACHRRCRAGRARCRQGDRSTVTRFGFVELKPHSFPSPCCAGSSGVSRQGALISAPPQRETVVVHAAGEPRPAMSTVRTTSSRASSVRTTSTAMLSSAEPKEASPRDRGGLAASVPAAKPARAGPAGRQGPRPSPASRAMPPRRRVAERSRGPDRSRRRPGRSKARGPVSRCLGDGFDAAADTLDRSDGVRGELVLPLRVAVLNHGKAPSSRVPAGAMCRSQALRRG